MEAEVGRPRVNYREAITQRAEFDYLHKKQSGGQGQYGRVVGFVEPFTPEAGLAKVRCTGHSGQSTGLRALRPRGGLCGVLCPGGRPH